MWRDDDTRTLGYAHRDLCAAPPAAVAARITIVLHDFSGGGTERVAIRLANAWAAEGRAVTIFCGTEAGPARAFVGPRVAVIRTGRECVRTIASRSTLGRALSGFGAAVPQDVVFAPGNFHLPVLARFAAAGSAGATTICKLSNPLALRAGGAAQRAIHAFALRRLARGIDGFVAMSPALRDEARQVLARDDIGLAWEPILAGTPQAAAERPPHRPLIVAAGRLERQKNFDLALDAFARSRAARDGELLILGEGSRAKTLARHAARLGIADRVRMPGYRASIADDLRRASAFLLTSRYEGYPAVLVEAIAAGAPVIATPCSPAIAEIVAGCPASAVVAPAADALARAIDAALARGRPQRAPGPNFLTMVHAEAAAANAYLHVLDTAHGRARFRRARDLS